MNPTVSPCLYPTCGTHNSDPELTTQGICFRCRARYKHTLRRLIVNYVRLRTQFPTPAHNEEHIRRNRNTEFGHPAEWASDTARLIADQLDGASEGLRDHLGHLPPPPRERSEVRVVNHSYQTLTTRFDALCTYPGAEATAKQLADLDRRINGALGFTRARKKLPTPCPACGESLLVREVATSGVDAIECMGCRETIESSHYGLYARMLLDEIIDNAERNGESS